MEHSKLLMDWASSKCQIENCVLIPIKNRVIEVEKKFMKPLSHTLTENSTLKPTSYLKKPLLWSLQ